MISLVKSWQFCVFVTFFRKVKTWPFQRLQRWPPKRGWRRSLWITWIRTSWKIFSAWVFKTLKKNKTRKITHFPNSGRGDFEKSQDLNFLDDLWKRGGIEQWRWEPNGVSQQCALRANRQTGQGFTWHPSHATFEVAENQGGRGWKVGLGWRANQ